MLSVGAAPRSSVTGARPDTSFGAGRGWVTTEVPGTSSVGAAAVITPNNRIAVAGLSATPTGNVQVVVARYRSDGSLDPTFGVNGIFQSAFPAADAPFQATAISHQPSTGKLVVAGGYGTGSILVLRLTPTGQLDPTFGPQHNGFVTVPVAGIAHSMGIDGKGRILVGSFDGTTIGKPMIVARFSPNGILDSSYGQNGLARLLFWNSQTAASAGISTLNVAADGSATGMGHIDYIGGNGHGAAGVFRLSPSGQLVPGFGSGGHTEVDFTFIAPRQFWFPCAMTVDARGRIVVTGDGDVASGPALLTARLTPNGTLDTSYGPAGTGRVVTQGLGGTADGQTNCGASVDATSATTVGVGAVLVQLTSRGVPNPKFGPGGIVQIGTPANVSLFGLTNAGSAKVLLTGSAGNAAYLARYWTR
jgi:uncharacterized delta-60 repeat protein